MSHADRLAAARSAAEEAEVGRIVGEATDELRGELAHVREQLDAAEAALAEAVDERDAQILRADQAEGERDQAAQERDQAQVRVAELEQVVVGLEQTVAQLQERIRELEQQQPDPEPSQPQPTPGFWWRRLDPADYPERVVMAHVTPWMPAVVSNEPEDSDYYTRNWLTDHPQAAVEQTHGKHGGRVRDAPSHDAPYPGGDPAWRIAAAEAEIEVAIDYGINGFFIDSTNSGITKQTNGHWAAISAYLEAAVAHPGFRIAPMIDCNGGIAGHSNEAIATFLRQFLDRPSAWVLPDGRRVVGVFHATTKADQWSMQRFNQIADLAGGNIAYAGTFVNVSHASQYPGFWAVGGWGSGTDPAMLDGQEAPGAAAARSRGQRPMISALSSGARPAQGWYDEYRGMGAEIKSWDQIDRETTLGGNPFVQVVTWSDWAEGTAIYPGRGQGVGPLAYLAYRADCWRAGQRLPILDDHVIVSHRNQLVNKPLSSTVQTQRMVPAGTVVNGKQIGPTRPRQTPSVDEVGVLTLLTRPARVLVNAGGVVSEYDAPEGESLRYVPTGAGTVRVEVRYGGGGVTQIESPIRITSTPVVDGPNWYHIWTHNPYTVYDPTPNGKV